METSPQTCASYPEPGQMERDRSQRLIRSQPKDLKEQGGGASRWSWFLHYSYFAK